MSGGGDWDESKHPRVPAGSPEGGQFGEGGGVEGARNTLLEMFRRIERPDGGFTYQPRLHFEPKTGYAVSIYPKRTFTKPHARDLRMLDCYRFMRKNIDLLGKHDHYFGGWNDPKNGRVHLDVSIVVTQEIEARRLAQRHDQISYFDFRNGRSVRVPKGLFHRKEKLG